MAEPAHEDTGGISHRKGRRWLVAGAASILIVGGLWVLRTPIADNLIAQQLNNRSVPARYTIERIGPVTQRLANVSIGDPAHPDLTARWIEVDIGYGWSGPYVAGLRADGVRLYGRVVDGALTLGSLDRFRDPASTDPISLPDIVVALSDARARVDTPWGDVGARLEGHGNLRHDFDGRLAMIAHGLQVGGCNARAVSFYGQLSIRKVEPQINGPLRAESVTCAAAQFTVDAPQVALQLALGDDLTHWKGSADAVTGRLTVASVAAEKTGLQIGFRGTAKQTDLKIDGKLVQVMGPQVSAQAVTIAAKANMGSDPIRAEGMVRAEKAVGELALRRAIMAGAASAAGTPIGPVANAAAGALARAIGTWDGQTKFLLGGTGQNRRLELISPQLNAASSARISGDGDSRIAFLLAADTPTLLVQGGWQFGGGGLPEGNIVLNRRADGSLDGKAVIQPYMAGASRIALSPVQFSGDRSGLIRFASVVTASGPLGDGWVEGLSLPIRGVVSPAGSLALQGGCTPVSIQSAKIGGANINASQIHICGQAGRPLLAIDSSGARGLLTIRDARLTGAMGTSPLMLSAAEGKLDLSTMRWGIRAAAVRVGQPDAATEFSIVALTGGQASKGLSGSLTGAEGHIGTVPLHLSRLGGEWVWQDGVLTLDGGLTVTDAASDARFQPLVSEDAKLRLADGRISATASFSEREKGRPVVDVVIGHQMSKGSGFADLHVRNLRFDQGFQPNDLSHLSLGVVANVNGTVTGDGRIDWTADTVTSSGAFTTSGTDLAAAFGPVTGASTTIHFDDLLGLHSLPGQKISLAAINPGFSIADGMAEYQLLGNNQVRIEGGSWPFAGGTLSLHPTTLDFNADQVRRLRFDLTGVDAAAFLQQFGFDNISATGVFDGTIPVVVDGLGSRIVNGRLDVRSGGGTLAYVGTLSNHDLGAMANFAFNALKSLKYDDLTIVLNGDLDGEMVTDIRFGGVGQGANASRNFITKRIAQIPLIFNVKISAPFRQLITSAKGFYDPSLLVEQNLPALIRAQEAKTPPATNSAVQPSESEPMP